MNGDRDRADARLGHVALVAGPRQQLGKPTSSVLGIGTYIRTREGWLHLAAILDLYSRLVAYRKYRALTVPP